MATANKKRSAAAADKAPEAAQPDQAQHEAVKAQRRRAGALHPPQPRVRRAAP